MSADIWEGEGGWELKFGHWPEGGGGAPGLPKLFGALFYWGGKFFDFLYRVTTGVLQAYCVRLPCSLLDFHWTNIILTFGTLLLIWGKSAPQVPKFHRGRGDPPLIWAMPKSKSLFMCVLPEPSGIYILIWH